MWAMSLYCVLFLWISLTSFLAEVASGFSVVGGGHQQSPGPPRTPSSPHRSDISEEVASEIRRAMHLTTKSSNGDINAAYEACSLWESLLGASKNDRIPADVRVLTLGMYASCLVRCGRDEAALPVFEEVLALRNYVDHQSLIDIIVEKASALQRLLRYNEARKEYLLAATSDRAIIGATICALRVWDLEGAALILRSSLQTSGITSRSPEVHSLCAIVDSFFESDVSDISDEVLLQLNATSHLSPVFRFASSVYARPISTKNATDADESESDPNTAAIDTKLENIEATLPNEGASEAQFNASETPNVSFSFVDFASVNVGAFDDPMLEMLDDKVRLHQLLSSNSRGLRCTFWPESLVLPDDAYRLSGYSSSQSWICKSRSGYGSHGNRILNSEEALTEALLMRDDAESLLLQKLVEPPLILDGLGRRKFTMRVYVVYFIASSKLPAEVHIVKNGLVKVAALPFNHDVKYPEDVLRIHMTNSGRETSMEQLDFSNLKMLLDESDVQFDDLWDRIRDSVRTLFLLYHDVAMRISDSEPRPFRLRDSLGRLGIPKILGFDYAVDESGEPWLLEVNRFPGLEPRDGSDTPVKHYVVKEAWMLACRRQGLDDTAWLDWET